MSDSLDNQPITPDEEIVRLKVEIDEEEKCTPENLKNEYNEISYPNFEQQLNICNIPQNCEEYACDFQMVHQTVRAEENNCFTLEQVNQATYEMKSPKSAFNFNTNKRENCTSPLLKKLEQFKDSSPEVLFAAFKCLAKNGTINKTKNNSVIDPSQKEDSDKKNDGAQELPVDMQVDIKELDESLATTKKVLEGNTIKLEEGDAEKKRKRQEKLKLKNKGLKLNIPSQNKFLAESANQKADNKSPQRKIYTPTPTRKAPIINPNDSGCEPFMFINQLSNKGIGKCNFESPFMFAEDINVTSLHCFDMKLCSPGRMMSPSIAGNQDYFKYHLQLSGSLLIHENRDNLLINISPRYVPKSMNKSNQDSNSK